jgi:ATP-binding cassette, subfamily B, bacterial
VLEDLSFAVQPGEVVALTGSTGAGKSTLTYLLTRLMDPTEGRIRVGGVDLTVADPDELRASVALVFQETFLFADTVQENLTLSSPAADATVDWATGVARADEFIGELDHGRQTVIGERGVTLSGGQRQRLALARALLRHPRLLILDDATSAVDPRIEQQILAGLRRELDMTTIVVAHRVSTIALADRVLYLADGRLVADGAHTDLLATVPGYEALIRAYEAADSAEVTA